MTFPTVSYINYGPYASYAPTYDSSFGNVSKEESDLIYSAFGDKSSLQGSDRYGHSWGGGAAPAGVFMLT